MDKEKKYPIKIKINNGFLKLNIKKSYLPNGTCKNCNKKIVWLKIKKKSFQLDYIDNNEYILHSLTCKTTKEYKDKIRKKKFNK